MKENSLQAALTFDRVRFLGTSCISSCKSGGSGKPKEKPPYLQESMVDLKTTRLMPEERNQEKSAFKAPNHEKSTFHSVFQGACISNQSVNSLTIRCQLYPQELEQTTTKHPSQQETSIWHFFARRGVNTGLNKLLS